MVSGVVEILINRDNRFVFFMLFFVSWSSFLIFFFVCFDVGIIIGRIGFDDILVFIILGDLVLYEYWNY